MSKLHIVIDLQEEEYIMKVQTLGHDGNFRCKSRADLIKNLMPYLGSPTDRRVFSYVKSKGD